MNVTPLGVVSLVNKFALWLAPTMPVVVFAVATEAPGGVTVGVIVEAPYWPSASATTYQTGTVAGPVNVFDGSKVTVPVPASNEYTPSAVVTEVAEQFDDVNGAVAAVGHKRKLVAFNVVPAPAVSFDAGAYV